MTEQEWLECADPQRMLAALLSVPLGTADGWTMTYGKQKVSDRKLRLFACACKAASGHWRPEAAYTYMEADGQQYPGNSQIPGDASFMARVWSEPPIVVGLPQATKVALLRDIVGNPFRQGLSTNPYDRQLFAGLYGSLTANTIGIADRIYTEGDWAALPILADALEDAGCTNRTILGHLRATHWVCCCGKPRDGSHDHNSCGPPIEEAVPHVRGCWAVDLILGKQ